MARTKTRWHFKKVYLLNRTFKFTVSEIILNYKLASCSPQNKLKNCDVFRVGETHPRVGSKYANVFRGRTANSHSMWLRQKLSGRSNSSSTSAGTLAGTDVGSVFFFPKTSQCWLVTNWKCLHVYICNYFYTIWLCNTDIMIYLYMSDVFISIFIVLSLDRPTIQIVPFCRMDHSIYCLLEINMICLPLTH